MPFSPLQLSSLPSLVLSPWAVPEFPPVLHHPHSSLVALHSCRFLQPSVLCFRSKDSDVPCGASSVLNAPRHCVAVDLIPTIEPDHWSAHNCPPNYFPRLKAIHYLIFRDASPLVFTAIAEAVCAPQNQGKAFRFLAQSLPSPRAVDDLVISPSASFSLSPRVPPFLQGPPLILFEETQLASCHMWIPSPFLTFSKGQES